MRSSVIPFANGHQLSQEPLTSLERALRHQEAHRVADVAAVPAPLLPEGGIAVITPPEPAPFSPQDVLGPAERFAAKAVDDGRSVAAVAELAKAQSQAGYDVLRANCQHYAGRVYGSVGGRVLGGLPNEELLGLFHYLWPPKATAQPHPFGGPLVSEVMWNAEQAPLRAGLSAALQLWPGHASPGRPPDADEEDSGGEAAGPADGWPRREGPGG